MHLLRPRQLTDVYRLPRARGDAPFVDKWIERQWNVRPARAGMDLAHIQDLYGHVDAGTTRTYARPTLSKQRDAIRGPQAVGTVETSSLPADPRQLSSPATNRTASARRADSPKTCYPQRSPT